MSRYNGFDYRGPPRDRSRSPARFGADRRQSSAGAFDSRPPAGAHRGGPDAQRGPRPAAGGPGPAPRTLREAPPLGSGDRGRFRDRDYERRPSPPRNRSPPRNARDPRDFPPRDLDTTRPRRLSRDGPLSAGSNFSDNPPFAPAARGGYGRGRGRGDYEYRPGRGGRRIGDDRDLYMRDRSPPPRYGRDLSRDSRDADRRDIDRRDSDRRDDRPRFERRDDDRRIDWSERDRELDRARREPPPPSRLEPRASTESIASASATYPSTPAPPINPERLAIIESTGAPDNAARRPTVAQASPAPRDVRREPPSEAPAYLNGRAETVANRYGSRGSSPPTQAPPVPAFSFSMPTSAPPAAPVPVPASTSSAPAVTTPASTPIPTNAPSAASASAAPTTTTSPKQPDEAKPDPAVDAPPPAVVEAKPTAEDRPAPPPNAPAAPKSERAPEPDKAPVPSDRLQSSRSMDSISSPPLASRPDAPASQQGSMPTSPVASRQGLPQLTKSMSPIQTQPARFADISAPTGPKATRNSGPSLSGPAQPPFTSPRTDAAPLNAPTGPQSAHSPPPSAPSGPRRQSISVSPKVAHSSVPTAPKGPRGAPPLAPRAAAEPRGQAAQARPAMPPFAPPSGPRNLQWNQWRRPPPQMFNEKLGSGIPAKRDANGDEKERSMQADSGPNTDAREPSADSRVKLEDRSDQPDAQQSQKSIEADAMDVDRPSQRRVSRGADGHSAAQSFFGKTLEKTYDEMDSSSEEDELDEEEDATLLEAKHARAERELRSQKADLSESRYRATTPLESIARLARISMKDLQRVTERDQEMEIDEQLSSKNHQAPPATHSSDSDDGAGVPTPGGEDIAEVAIQSQEDVREPIRRLRRPTPEVIALPYMLKDEEPLPLQEMPIFQENLRTLEDMEADVMAELVDDLQAEDEAEEDNEELFRRLYRQWREECAALDREQEEKEKIERQLSMEPVHEADVGPLPSSTSTHEGRRTLKFSSEYEIEQVLKQSEETARIEQEKLEREALKVEADMQKEANIPDQEPLEVYRRSILIDANRLRHPDDLTLVFSYEPPADDFTEQEQRTFIAAFKDTPKKWGEIASLLPGRTYKDCIHHYYTNKWDGRFRDNRAKKFKGGRRGRGGKRVSRGSALMADLNKTDETPNPNGESATGRPRRAAAPTTFADKELESKLALGGPSPSKKSGASSKQEGDTTSEKGVKKRRTGEKPGRKAKTQLAALAAAPSAAAAKPSIQALPTKEELARAQTLEDASLLASFQSGHTGMVHPEGQRMTFEPPTAGFVAHMPVMDEPERPKASAAAASNKPSASSYWSVPEQQDFKKYIAHFGTDFMAIAAHMGTKTHTMIKNHYQRQVDGGGNTDLERLANEANARRDRGEDLGAPPTPTPIVKRKYDNPASNAHERPPRSIAPQGDAMDLDEHSPASHAKHASPPQFQNKPRFTTPAQGTPIQAHRVVPSPLAAASTPVAAPAGPAAAHNRTFQPPLGPLHSIRQEVKPEPRAALQGMQPMAGFRPAKVEQPTSAAPPLAPSASLGRNMPNPLDPQYLQSLAEQQDKAMRQADYGHMKEPLPSHAMARGSPATRARQSPPPHERRPLFEERPAPGSPPRMYHSQAKSTPSWMQQPSGTAFSAPTGPAAMSGRGPDPSSQLEPARPGPGMSGSPHHQHPLSAIAPQPPVPTPTPGPPKRSNLSSILNSDPDPEPRVSVVRDPAPSTRPASPASSMYSGGYGSRSMDSSRREPYAQAPSHLHRSAYPPPGNSTTNPLSVKHEPPTGPAAMQSMPPSSGALDRDGRGSYMHRSTMGAMAQPSRGAASPPPYGHSRTPSLPTGPTVPPPRDHRSLLGQPPQAQTPGPSAAPQPYGMQQQGPPYSQAPRQDLGRGQPSHNASLDGSRDRYYPQERPDDSYRSRQAQIERERDPYAMHYRQEVPRESHMSHSEMERHRQLEQRQHDEQRRQEMLQQDLERQRREGHNAPYSRAPPLQPSHAPSPFGSSSYGSTSRPSVGGLRAEAMRESQIAMQHEEQRRLQQQQQDEERRRHHHQEAQYMRDREPMDYGRRRPDEPPHYGRSTPQGYSGQGYQPPPQQQPGPAQSRR